MSEREIEQILTNEVRKAGGVAYKFTSPGNDGVPDRIVLMPGGRIVFAELKTDTGVVSRLQDFQIRRISALGQEVVVVRGIRGCMDLLAEIGINTERLRKKYLGKEEQDHGIQGA